MRRSPRPTPSGRLDLPSGDDTNEENIRLRQEEEDERQLEDERKLASWHEANRREAKEREEEAMRQKAEWQNRRKKREKQTGGKKRRKKRKKTRKKRKTKKKHKNKTRRGGNKKAKKYWRMPITKRWKKNPLSFIFPKTNWLYQTAKLGVPL